MNYQNRIVYKINKNIHDIIYTKNIVKSLDRKIIDLKSDKKIIFLYDENISTDIIKDILLGLKLTGCKISSKKIKSLKKNKNIKSVLDLINTFTQLSLTKKSVVITCGGGVIGDLAGLASCLYKRGLIYINIPSTMTALVDSCIGGKTGINHNKQINLIGNQNPIGTTKTALSQKTKPSDNIISEIHEKESNKSESYINKKD